MKWLPNALSLSRVGFGPLVAYFAISRQWEWALAALLAGLVTDWLDGWFAIKLDAKSHFGATVLEPICDFVLSAGAVGGLVLTGYISWLQLGVMAFLFVGGGIWDFVLDSGPLKRFSHAWQPLYYLAVIIVVTLIYVRNFDPDYFGVTMIITPPVLVLVGYKKRHRLFEWLGVPARQWT